MKAIREDVLQQAFVDMWNKLYTNQGIVLEPLLKALTELAASKPDTEEIEQLDNEIHSLSEQSRILNQVMKKGYMDSALFMEKGNQLAHRLTECRRKKTLLGFVVNDEYKAWIEDIKKRIKQSQIKAAVKVNYELLELYWGIGRDIVAKQKHAKWDDAFLATMSKDLQKSFPDMSGFSVQNLKSIRYWYKFYNSEENGLQPVSRMELIENMVKSIPWGHNQRIK